LSASPELLVNSSYAYVVTR